MAGVTAEGFVLKTAAEILASIEASQKGALGADLDVSPEQPLGQLNGIVAAQLGEVWELGAALYAGRRPSTARFAALDAVCEITAVERRGATHGTVTLSVTLGAGVTLAAGAVASVAGQSGNRWVTTAAAVNSSGSTATVSVAARAEAAGVLRANAGTITVIATPTAGWTAVTNPLDAVPGAAAELDPVLRRRRADEVRAGGSSPLDAVRAAVRAVSGVTDVQVFQNTRATTVDGLPPHSIEVVAVGGDDQAIAEAIWAGAAAGIETHGTTTRTVVDAGGITRTVRFSRPTVVPIYVVVDVEYDASTYPTRAALLTVVSAAVAALGDSLRTGEQVRVEWIRSTVFRLPGVLDVRRIAIGRSDAPSNVGNVPMSRRELADLDTSRVRLWPT